MVDEPPAVPGNGRLLEYAELNGAVQWSGDSRIWLGDGERGWKVLGRVPRLAITEDPRTGQLALLHCELDWEVAAADSGHRSLEELKARAERSIPASQPAGSTPGSLPRRPGEIAMSSVPGTAAASATPFRPISTS